jgi:thioredoxin 1
VCTPEVRILNKGSLTGYLVMKEIKMLEEPIHVTDPAFDKTVLQASIPVIVDFWAPWCGPCKMVAPVLEKLAKEYAGKLLIAKVNVDDNPESAGKFDIRNIPTMLFISNGKIVHMQVGALPEVILRSIVTQFLTVVEKASVVSNN